MEQHPVRAQSISGRDLQEETEGDKGRGKRGRKGGKGEGRMEGEAGAGAAAGASNEGNRRERGERSERDGAEGAVDREAKGRGKGNENGGVDREAKGEGKGGENGGETAAAARGRGRGEQGGDSIGDGGAGRGDKTKGEGKGEMTEKMCVYVCKKEAEDPFKAMRQKAKGASTSVKDKVVAGTESTTEKEKWVQSMKDKWAMAKDKKDGSADASSADQKDKTSFEKTSASAVAGSTPTAGNKVARHEAEDASAGDKELEAAAGDEQKSKKKKSKMAERREKAAAMCSCATEGVSGVLDIPLSNVAQLEQSDEQQDNFGDAVLGALIDVVEVDAEQVALGTVDLVRDGAEGAVNLVKGVFRRLTTAEKSAAGKARIEYEIAATDATQQQALQQKLAKPENWSKFQASANEKLAAATNGEVQLTSAPVVVAAPQPVMYNTMLTSSSTTGGYYSTAASGTSTSSSSSSGDMVGAAGVRSPQNSYLLGGDQASGAAGLVVGMNAFLASLMTVYLVA
eukprot:CAMPEP_0178993150 /NCGR_PEP_ID=MMETSP0795-20121207/6536_1 /TAXON_ID=88552 /ORGANISM="Amoebophrya sp., Strain Ameob2" /LENGTH=511 /DNA_ID=CAMNT_0020685163 /DNA_START=336 /DNA_END=1871 /DNA_ORIENTATION=+